MPQQQARDSAAPNVDSLLDAIALPVVVLDEQAKIVRANAAFRELSETGVGEPYASEDAGLRERVRSACEATADSSQHGPLSATFAGRTYWVHVVGVAGTTPPMRMVSHLEIRTDQAELTRLQQELDAARQQLLQAQKLESVGRLSSGVAHDFNNMLTSIICFTRFVVDEMVAEDPRRADLIEVLKAADQAARLTNQLLAFARRKPLQPVPINVNDAVLSVGRVLRRTLGEHIELVIEPSDEALWVNCDPGQFDQLLFNLSVQTQDALPAGGAITIRLGRSHILDESGLPTGDYVELAFLHKHSAPTPQASSEWADHSSGLGLATCRVIAEQAQGALLPHADAVDVGYRVLLPAVEVRSGAARRASLAPVQLSGTALVVEDQPAILRTMVRALSAAGLSVLEANSAEDALAVLSAKPQTELALVVADVVLPHMSGPRLAEQLRATYPDLPVLFVSGYIGEELVSGVQASEGTAFVMKPFTGRQLAVRAAALLGKRGATRAASET